MGVGYNKSDSRYCCGAIRAEDDSVKCTFEEPFQISEGTVLPDVAYLENNGVKNTTSDSNTTYDHQSNSCLAVEAGVSVPLGVIAVASFIWALWERRKRRHPGGFGAVGSESGLPLRGSRQVRTAELNAPGGHILPELMDTRTEYKEVPSESGSSRF